MAPVWILILSVFKIYAAQSVAFDEPASFLSGDLGHTASLQCKAGVKSRHNLILWYKQKLGGIPQAIGMISLLNSVIVFPPFNKTAFQLNRNENVISLKILNVTKDDEAMYFCGRSQVNVIEFFSGIFLSVRDESHLKVSVRQRGVLDSVPAGASVTLQCSVLSESRAAELQVLWFRAAPAQSHPQIIYTHHNSSRQCESGSSTHTCVFNFTKNILSLSDTGTYYCAVAACGKIVFGNGTRVQMASPVNPLLIILATSLGVCGILITAQTIMICKRTHDTFHSERLHNGVVTERATDQECDGKLNYAALHFNKRKTKSGRRNSERPQAIVYSEVRRLTATD